MKGLTSLAVTSFTALTIGCASRSPQIELTASDFDVSPLVGQWRGEYTGNETGRSGTIAFTLRAGEAAASGNVLMLPRTADSTRAAADRAAGEDVSPVSARQVLTIHFVRKEGGNLVGTLDPYRDPDCACQVTTTFQGSFSNANTIQGTFTTVPSRPGASVTGGKWSVTRVKRL
jgi:hypothetical protein